MGWSLRWQADLLVFQSDSVSYFFEDLDRISRPDYAPSQKDILHCRKATKGVFEFTIRIQVSARLSLNSPLLIIFPYRTFHSSSSTSAGNEHNVKNGQNASTVQ
jgi:hypothetical protein